MADPKRSLLRTDSLLVRVFAHGIVMVVASLLAVALVIALLIAPRMEKGAGSFGRAVAPRLCQELVSGTVVEGFPATVYSNEGALLGSTLQPPLAPLSAGDLARLRANGDYDSVGVHAFPCTGRAAYLLLGRPQIEAPVSTLYVALLAVLIVVSVGSWPLARSLVSPLSGLVSTAGRFGQGELGARTHSTRKDELGDLSRAFDDMADRLQLLIRAEKELLANVSHELRTPLARIRVVLELAEEEPARAQALLREIGHDVQDLERLVEDVMEALRLDLGSASLTTELPLHREDFSLTKLVAAEVASLRLTHPARDIAAPEAGELRMNGDPHLLRRVVDNLLQNALKYSESGTQILVRCFETEGETRLTVVDHGLGISKDDLPHVFRPFFRGDKSRRRETGGVGLGLSLAKRIVEAHSGKISIESEVGVGTTVTVVLPKQS